MSARLSWLRIFGDMVPLLGFCMPPKTSLCAGSVLPPALTGFAAISETAMKQGSVHGGRDSQTDWRSGVDSNRQYRFRTS